MFIKANCRLLVGEVRTASKADVIRTLVEIAVSWGNGSAKVLRQARCMKCGCLDTDGGEGQLIQDLIGSVRM